MTVTGFHPLPSDDGNDEARSFNRELARRLALLPDQWSFPPAVIRERRAEGNGPFPPAQRSSHARTRMIAGPHGEIPLRILAPRTRPATGAYLYLHGGGWTLGGADEHDMRLEEIAEATGLIGVACGYRLAPEHPYPQGLDDCETAARWLVETGRLELGIDKLTMGGDSAGANLAAATLIRLRDGHGLASAYKAVVFGCGCFDLRLTPSARRWGAEKLVLNTRDLTMFVRHYLAHGHDPALPDISPLMADLSDLPPAHFVVGTADPLLDDTLFMAERWRMAGNHTELALYPDGCHVFQQFPLTIAADSNRRIEGFLHEALGEP
ncbi:alpha/beta hydrolase [Stappia indica]|uniref:alpha/beta hydrolase n=1 Tax=Stappia indica TaxID=538381 RepID=UPI001CD4A8FD|nr:alpha/beta hydrolase [Stappia indica]MCA1297960.1 alpha/beta hydrolase [Stappia indica]